MLHKHLSPVEVEVRMSSTVSSPAQQIHLNLPPVHPALYWNHMIHCT